MGKSTISMAVSLKRNPQSNVRWTLNHQWPCSIAFCIPEGMNHGDPLRAKRRKFACDCDLRICAQGAFFNEIHEGMLRMDIGRRHGGRSSAPRRQRGPGQARKWWKNSKEIHVAHQLYREGNGQTWDFRTYPEIIFWSILVRKTWEVKEVKGFWWICQLEIDMMNTRGPARMPQSVCLLPSPSASLWS